MKPDYEPEVETEKRPGLVPEYQGRIQTLQHIGKSLGFGGRQTEIEILLPLLNGLSFGLIIPISKEKVVKPILC